MNDKNNSHIVIVFLLSLISANLILLDLKVFSQKSTLISEISKIALPSPTVKITLKDSEIPCGKNCVLNLINEATRNIGVQTVTNPPIAPIQAPKTTVSREYYIPLGTGSTSKSEWDDITSTETVIDPSNYGTIKEAYFIASLSNPTLNGQVEAQIYNVTSKHPVWGSHVIMNGPSSQTITSGKITLDSGAKLYRVQLKSTLQFPASLTNSKIRVIAE